MRKKRLSTYSILAAAVLGWMALPLTSHAADANDYTVVVKADRAVEEAKYEPQKIQIISKKDIEEKQAKTVEEIIFNKTGVSRTVDAMGRVGVSIRGAEPRHTLILVDGQPVMGEFAKYMGAADEVGRIGTENVERIEIIQGAASAKYGADAIGGVINVITKKAAKKPVVQFNIEGRKTARAIPHMQKAPYSNFYLRADSGEIGNARFSIYGSKRDVMPVAAANERRKVSFLFAQDVSEFPTNSLRYYGETSNAGVMGTIDLSKTSKVEFRADHFNENMKRFVKHTNSDMEPMVQFKRKADRNTFNVSYSGSKGDTDWRVEGNYTRMKEDDISLTSDYATSYYEGKNTLNSVDNIDHKQYSFKTTVNHALNDDHLLTVGFGMSREDGSGSRLKSAPKTHVERIDPWDYDKALYVDSNPSNSSNSQKGFGLAKVASKVHDYAFAYNKEGIPSWDIDQETVGYNPKDPNTRRPPVSFEKYFANKSDYDRIDPELISKEDVAARDKFNEMLYEENKATLEKVSWFSDYQKAHLITWYYAPTKWDPPLTFNGKKFLEDYKARDNQVTIGEASINKQFVTLQDTWTIGYDTTVVPILRYDHSNLYGGHLSASVGITHNWKSDPNTRLKANIGTGYAEPGMGELYYNWEMYGGNPIGFGFARMGWYFIGNPSLKPEKSVNMDIGIEKEWKKTSLKASLFHNRIKDYMTIYFTGNLLDFNPWLNSSTSDGFWKFMYPPDMIYSFKNIGRATITGGDVEITHNFNKHWQATLGYTYLNARNESDPSMPAKLLDKPTHKIDIGINYKDDKRGWSGSLYGNYYVDMLDSNALESKGSYLETDGWGAPHPTIKYFFKDKDKHQYQKKTYGIWNFIVQKKFNDSAKAYFAIDNVFNHRDDDRALQEKVYRAGVNFKMADVFDTKPAIDPVTGKKMVATMTPFIVSPFDTSLKVGTKVHGDVRVRNSYELGENRPEARVTPSSMVSAGASESLRDQEFSAMETRIRLGVNARLGENTNFDFLGSLSAVDGVDTKAFMGDRGPKHARIEKAELTQHANQWDLSVGRIHQELGVTGYWFGKEYDGARAVYTSNKAQVSMGVGTFKNSTGIDATPYTHATYQQYMRPPYLYEFLGLAEGTYGGFDGLLPADKMPKDNDNVAFAKQLVDVMNAYLETPEGKKMKPIGGFTNPELLPDSYPIMKLVTILRHMQSEVAKAYAGNTRLYNSGPKEKSFSGWGIVGRDLDFGTDRLDIEVETKDGIKHYGNYFLVSKYGDGKYIDTSNASLSSWKDKDVEFAKTFDSSPFYISLGDKRLFEGKTKDDLLKAWWNDNGKNYIAQTEKILRFKLDDPSIKIITPPDEIRKQLVEGLFLSPGFGGRYLDKNDNLNVPNFVITYIEALTKALNYVDNGTKLPREALRSTGYGVPAEGIVLVRDNVPAIDKAFFVQGKYQLNKHIGLNAWHLQSFGGDSFKVEHANGTKNDMYSFKNPASVFGVGAQLRLNDYSSISVDAGINTAPYGKHLNGQTVYEHEIGTNVFGLKGYKEGKAPKFWTVRFNIGAVDTKVPKSWNAFLDYKHFDHGAFFGGNGTEGVPDYYLDGIQSYTLGGSYVPARNWLVEAYYTFGAKGVKKRDTLFGSENFTLGDYTRLQVTYKF